MAGRDGLDGSLLDFDGAFPVPPRTSGVASTCRGGRPPSSASVPIRPRTGRGPPWLSRRCQAGDRRRELPERVDEPVEPLNVRATVRVEAVQCQERVEPVQHHEATVERTETFDDASARSAPRPGVVWRWRTRTAAIILGWRREPEPFQEGVQADVVAVDPVDAATGLELRDRRGVSPATSSSPRTRRGRGGTSRLEQAEEVGRCGRVGARPARSTGSHEGCPGRTRGTDCRLRPSLLGWGRTGRTESSPLGDGLGTELGTDLKPGRNRPAASRRRGGRMRPCPRRARRCRRSQRPPLAARRPAVHVHVPARPGR